MTVPDTDGFMSHMSPNLVVISMSRVSGRVLTVLDHLRRCSSNEKPQMSQTNDKLLVRVPAMVTSLASSA